MVDEDKVRALARRRGVSESAAVREAVDVALLAEEFDDAMRELSALGGIDDVFGKMPVESEQPAVERRRADG
jgi:hypothetical protein